MTCAISFTPCGQVKCAGVYLSLFMFTPLHTLQCIFLVHIYIPIGYACWALHLTATFSLSGQSYFTCLLEWSEKSRLLYFCRVVILVIVMLIVVPLLNISEIDNTQLIAVELLQQMAVYNANSTSSYGVRRLLLFMSECHMILDPSSSHTVLVWRDVMTCHVMWGFLLCFVVFCCVVLCCVVLCCVVLCCVV